VYRVAHLEDIVGPQALLDIRQALAGRVGLAEQEREQRMHARSSEQHARVVLGDQRRAADDGVAVLAEKVEIQFSKGMRIHSLTPEIRD
jgi:hypothetical protein